MGVMKPSELTFHLVGENADQAILIFQLGNQLTDILCCLLTDQNICTASSPQHHTTLDATQPEIKHHLVCDACLKMCQEVSVITSCKKKLYRSDPYIHDCDL